MTSLRLYTNVVCVNRLFLSLWMPRYKILLEYDGAGFCGWQKQANGVSIQACVECAICKFTGESVEVFGSSRTDAGVHAIGFVAHFDLSKQISPRTIVYALNFHLKMHKIVVLACDEADANFHARFSAKKKLYEYTILNRVSRPTLDYGRTWHVLLPLDILKMKQAAKLIEGTHDFIGIQTSQCQAKSTLRTIESITIKKNGDKIFIQITAPSFIHKMVRNIVGALKMVGLGKWNDGHIRAMLNASEPMGYKATAPACGLCLVKVIY